MKRSETLCDCFFLVFVVSLSFVLYVPGLGFYADDWAYIGGLHTSAERSFLGQFRSIYSPDEGMRPVQMLYFTALYSAFGMQPLGYHLVNGTVLALGAVLFYLVLRGLAQARPLALSVSLLYALLPHYSADRFWISASQANLSMALYFASLYCGLRSADGRERDALGWQLAAVAGALASALAYEIFLPLLFLNPLVVWLHARRVGAHGGPRALAPFFACHELALTGAVVFKMLATQRLGRIDVGKQLSWFAGFLGGALDVSFGDFGFRLPHVVLTLSRARGNWSIFALTAVVAVSVAGAVYASGRGRSPLPAPQAMRRLATGGLLVFVLGYATFLTNRNAGNTAAGIGNRINIAAAVGVAMTMVGTLGWLAFLFRSEVWRRRLFAGSLALLCASGVLINNTLATFWAEAYRAEESILTAIRRKFPALPPGATVILDGVCPYIGPAIVFESPWDLSGALQMLYRDRTLRADVVTPELRVGEDGLVTVIYNDETRYPYEKLVVYRFDSDERYALADAAAARRYFETFDPKRSGCAWGKAGEGVRVF